VRAVEKSSTGVAAEPHSPDRQGAARPRPRRFRRQRVARVVARAPVPAGRTLASCGKKP